MMNPGFPVVGVGQIGGVEPGAGGPGAGGGGGFDFRHFWHQLLEKLWVVVLCTLAGLFLALGYLSRTTPLYQSRVTLQVDLQDPDVVPIAGARSGSLGGTLGLASLEALRTIEQNLRNRALLVRVIRAENLAADGGKALIGVSLTENAAAGSGSGSSPAPTPTPASAPVAGAGAGATSDYSGTAAPPTALEEALAGALSQMVNATVRRGTRLIDVFVIHRDPALARRIADSLGNEFIRASIARRVSFNQEALRFLVQQAEQLRGDLQKAEKRVTEFKEKNPNALYFGGGAAATGSGSGTSNAGRGGVVETRLEKLSSDLTAVKGERVRLEGELALVDRAKGNINTLLDIPFIANAPAVVNARRDLNALQAQVAALAQRYKDKHPRMLAAKAALGQAEASFERVVLDQPSLLRSAVEQARTNETNLGSASREQEGVVLDLSKAAIDYQELARQADGIRQLYEKVLNQIKETDLAKGIQVNAVSVAERANQPGRPFTPQPVKATLLGIFGGLALGLGLVFLLSAIDRTVKTVDQAESTFGLPVLAAIPDVKAGETKGKKGERPAKSEPADRANGGGSGALEVPQLISALAPEGQAAEAFRNLRAALSLLGPEAERRVFLFTSALPNEGKSFTCANYALSLSQQGYRVLLIDGDLRRPTQHKFFLSNDAQPGGGIVDYLVGVHAAGGGQKSGGDGAENPTSLANLATPIPGAGGSSAGSLHVLSGGRRAPNPAELLGGHTFNDLIADAAANYDRVVVDSAPVLAVSDTLLMLPSIQTTCLVVRARKTPRNAVSRALALLSGAASGGRLSTGVAGLILNRLPRRRGVGYYYYYSESGGYGDSYSGGYGYRPDADAGPRATVAATGRGSRRLPPVAVPESRTAQPRTDPRVEGALHPLDAGPRCAFSVVAAALRAAGFNHAAHRAASTISPKRSHSTKRRDCSKMTFSSPDAHRSHLRHFRSGWRLPGAFAPATRLHV